MNDGSHLPVGHVVLNMPRFTCWYRQVNANVLDLQTSRQLDFVWIEWFICHVVPKHGPVGDRHVHHANNAPLLTIPVLSRSCLNGLLQLAPTRVMLDTTSGILDEFVLTQIFQSVDCNSTFLNSLGSFHVVATGCPPQDLRASFIS